MLARRDFLIAMVQALLLALFPTLRTERGMQMARQAAERWIPFYVNGTPCSTWKEVMALVNAVHHEPVHVEIRGPVTIDFGEDVGVGDAPER